MTEPTVANAATPETAAKLGLLPDEWALIQTLLGRVPNFTELSIFSVMWSEHCSYKNSIVWLKTLPRKGGRLLVEAGEENAGLVDIGDGLACAFKIESHNHPSAIEPYQGAATGVGGIHRDIFTMGARPIAALNSLRFGDPTRAHTRRLMRGVVKGIGDYGNSFGVPTVGGEVFFHPCFNQNILVNAMSAGVVEVGKTISATAQGIGNPVFIVGSATGKDGIHGATFASGDLTADSAKDLPAVQVGDPFQEKLLLEATLEALAAGVVVAMQDMGAAGITCSTTEMCARGNVGMKIDLSKVPTRQANMKPFEILLSESQERMLIIGEAENATQLQAIFDKWDLPCAQIGHLTEGGTVEYYMNGERVAAVPAAPLCLGSGAPVYHRTWKTPAYLEKIAACDFSNLPLPKDKIAAARAVAFAPNVASKRWVFEQYDSMVRTNTMTTNSPADAAVVRIKGTNKALALTVDCNPCYVYADPYKGAMMAVAEAARNVVCAGAIPLAVTNNLNFGNPYNEEVYYQFKEAVTGMGDACRRFGTPVTGGNVSFYNQSVYADRTEAVYPTPTIGMLGLLENADRMMSLDFKAEGDLIYLIGTSREDFGSSEYLRTVHQWEFSPAPHFDLEEEALLQECLIELIAAGKLKSAHDLAEGGLFAALLESAMPRELGFEILNDTGLRWDAYLFGESQSRVIISVDPKEQEAVEQLLRNKQQAFTLLGKTAGKDLIIGDDNYGTVSEWKIGYDSALATIMDSEG